jgi:acetylornithine/N-succinyldiaminopimelate aminotransferase
MRLKDTGMTVADLKAKVNKYMIETYERMDFLCDYAKGAYMYDQNGDAYLDFYGGVAVNSVGNCNDEVVKAVQEQVTQVMHTFNYPYTVPQAVLSEKICKASGMDKIIYQNSGAEANEAMIKMARKYGVDNFGPNKWHIVTAKSSFHGRTFGAMTATGQPDSAIQVGFGGLTPGFSYAEFNNLEAFKAAVTDDTIAIMFEAVQGEGGVFPATQEFMTGIRKLCDEKGIFMLMDEIQAGWNRTGTFMAYQNYGVKPDACSMAKAMGGGTPIAACAATDKLASAFTPGSHGSTYAGSPMCCAASNAVFDYMERTNIAAHVKEIGEYFMAELAKMPHVKLVRGKGLFVGVILEDGINAVEVKRTCVKNHLLVTAIGSGIIRMVPPLIVTKEECDECVRRLSRCINLVKDGTSK